MGTRNPEGEAVRAAMRRLVGSATVMASRAITLEGRPFHYLEGGAGFPLVLVHGAGGGSANWYRLFPALARRFRVLAPDLPGFGLSAASTAVFPMGRMVARLLADWLLRIGIESCALVGTSFGGLAALRLVQSGRVRVKCLVLVDSAGLGRAIHPLIRVAGARLLSGWAVRPSRTALAWLFHRLLIAREATIPPAEAAALMHYLHASAVAADARLLARAYELFTDWRGQREFLSDAELRALALPVAVLWGARDRLLPCRHGKRAAECIPEAQLQVLPGVGHSPNWEAPEAVLESILVQTRDVASTP